MTALADGLRFSDYENLTHALTHKICGWARAAGGHLAYEDVFQDLALVWVRCRDQFDPSQGAKFGTYYYNAALHEWGRFKREIRVQRRTVSASVSGEEDGQDGQDERGADITGIADDATASPEEQLIQRQRAAVALRRNPLMHRLISLSVEAPDDLQAELHALAAQRDWAARCGTPISETPPTALTPVILSRIFGFNWRHKIMMHLSVPKGY